jgi:hypothetical protein
MPPGPSHIPNSGERTALQKLRAMPGLPLAKLHPVGKQTVAGLLAKGWVLKYVDVRQGPLYRITVAGEAALTAKIPTKLKSS